MKVCLITILWLYQVKYSLFKNSLPLSEKVDTAYRKVRRILRETQTKDPREDFIIERPREEPTTGDLRFRKGGNSGTKVVLFKTYFVFRKLCKFTCFNKSQIFSLLSFLYCGNCSSYCVIVNKHSHTCLQAQNHLELQSKNSIINFKKSIQSKFQ